MRVIYAGIADLLSAVQRKERLRDDVDLMLAAENFFAVYYLSLLGWLSGQTTKQAFVKRLRVKLALAIDGLRLPADATEAPKHRRTAKS
jgi:hypothetical protein